MLRIICENVLVSLDDVERVDFSTIDITSPELEAHLKAVTPPFRRRIIGVTEIVAPIPQPEPEPEPEPIPSPVNATLLYDVPEGALVDENVFGFTLLHAGKTYYTPNMTPDGGATGGRMTFKWSRTFISWSGNVEKVQGVYDWSSIDKQADYFAAHGIHWSLVLTPVAPSFYSVGLRGPASTEAPYKSVLKAAYARYWAKGLRAHEICNEPETDNWYGALGRKPAGALEIRRVARELSPWARVASEAASEYFATSGNKVEIWASSSQSMADASSTTGLARVFNDPSAAANSQYGGTGFLNGSDGKGGVGVKWLDRFTFHGYPNPTHDGTLLHAHFLKAKAWLAAAGRPDLPMVVTEHGMLSARDPNNGDKSNGQWREWKTDNPLTGKAPAVTAQEQMRWVLNAFAVSAIHKARMIWYAWDERYMGIFGFANGPLGGSPTSQLGWIPAHLELEAKYKALREKLIGKRIFSLWKQTNGALVILVGTTQAQSELIILE